MSQETLQARYASTSQNLTLDSAQRLPSGENPIYEVAADRVAKMYRRRPREYLISKLRRMTAIKPGVSDGVSVAWPEDILLNSADGVIGYAMRRVEGHPASAYYLPKNRRRYAPWFDYELLLTAAKNIARAVQSVHDQDYVVGNINDSNILISESDASVALTGADSFYPVNGPYISPVRRPEYAPRERWGEDVYAAKTHDLFGLAIIIYRLLMEGVHPFAVRYVGLNEPSGLDSGIARGHFSHSRQIPQRPGSSEPLYVPPPGSTLWSALPPDIRDLFIRCFDDGHYQPEKRPTAWRMGASNRRMRQYSD